MPIKLRDYQEEALFAVDQSPDQRIYNPYIELPTGSGKTIIFGEGARRRGCRTLIFAHTDELIQQAYDKLHTVWPEAEIGIVKADRNEVDAEVIIGSVQTLSRPARLRELKKDFGFIVTDEVHHSAAPSYLRIYDYFELPRKETLSLGVTATPFRGDRKPLEAFSGPVYRKLIKEMIEAGWLCDLRGIAVDTSIDLDEVRMFGEDFLESDLSRVVNSPNRNELIVEAYLKYARDRKLTLCFTVDVQHALDLAETFREAGISAEAIHGKMGVEERRKILERFHNQETKVITNCQVLTEGYDEPGIDCIILGRPTMSILLHYQMIGRGTRPFPGKDYCLFMDFVDNTRKYKLDKSPDVLGIPIPLDASQSALEVIKEEKEKELREARKKGELYGPPRKIEKVERVDLFGEKIFEEPSYLRQSRYLWKSRGRDMFYLDLGAHGRVWILPSQGKYLIGYVSKDRSQQEILRKDLVLLDWTLGIGESYADEKSGGKLGLIVRDARWRYEPASSDQKNILEKYGIKYAPNITKRDATDMIEKLGDRATDRQMAVLNRYGLRYASDLTKREARDVIGLLRSF